MGQTVSLPILPTGVVSSSSIKGETSARKVATDDDNHPDILPDRSFPAVREIVSHLQAINGQIDLLANNDDAKVCLYNELMMEEPRLQDFLATFTVQHNRKAAGAVRALTLQLEAANLALTEKKNHCDDLTEDLQEARATALERDDEIDRILASRQQVQVDLEEAERELATTRKDYDQLVMSSDRLKVKSSREIGSLRKEVETLKLAAQHWDQYQTALGRLHEQFVMTGHPHKKRHLDEIDPAGTLCTLAAHPHLASPDLGLQEKAKATRSTSKQAKLTGTFDETKHSIRFSSPDASSSSSSTSSSPTVFAVNTPLSTPPYLGPVKMKPADRGDAKAQFEIASPGQLNDEELHTAIDDVTQNILDTQSTADRI